jgi:hypothetical protein
MSTVWPGFTEISIRCLHSANASTQLQLEPIRQVRQKSHKKTRFTRIPANLIITILRVLTYSDPTARHLGPIRDREQFVESGIGIAVSLYKRRYYGWDMSLKPRIVRTVKTTMDDSANLRANIS